MKTGTDSSSVGRFFGGLTPDPRGLDGRTVGPPRISGARVFSVKARRTMRSAISSSLARPTAPVKLFTHPPPTKPAAHKRAAKVVVPGDTSCGRVWPAPSPSLAKRPKIINRLRRLADQGLTDAFVEPAADPQAGDLVALAA